MAEQQTLRDAAELRAANINPGTLLATDYLNHFNEVLMLIEMLPSMPECAADVFAWRPLSYNDYFELSTFKGKALAIELYNQVQPELKERFEGLIGEINEKVFALIEKVDGLEGDMKSGQFDILAFTASTEIRPLIDHASALINGTHDNTDWMLAVDHPTAQDEIDRLFD